MEKDKLLITCLFEAQLFETYWAYYTYGPSPTYEKDCRIMAKKFVDTYEKILSIDPKYNDPSIYTYVSDIDISRIIGILKDWADGQSYYPYSNLIESNSILLHFFVSLKILLLKDLNLPNDYSFLISLNERRYHDQFIRWKGHIPGILLAKIENPSELIFKASSCQSIALIGDIRRSQDLMTYSIDPDHYSQKMEDFITTTRKLIEKNLGFFDKFTGDGFIVYFNEELCRIVNQNYEDCFINFIRDEMNFAIPFFEEWERSIRRRPIIKIGLALGADKGEIKFKDIKNHLIAVGDAIVWGTRMASFSLANEVLVNNLLHSFLLGREDISLREHKGKTKSGDNFLAYKLNLL